MCATRRIVFALYAAILSAGPPLRDVAAQSPQEVIYPPHSVVEGKTIGDWLSEFWRWRAETPLADVDALLTCRDGPFAEVFFLPTRLPANPPRNDPDDPDLRTCTIPAGVPTFVEIISNFAWDCGGCDACRDIVSRNVDRVTMVEFEIRRLTASGESVAWEIQLSRNDFLAHREPSDTCVGITIPQDNVLIANNPGHHSDNSLDRRTSQTRTAPSSSRLSTGGHSRGATAPPKVRC